MGLSDFHVVDVFASAPFQGNPVMVVHAVEELDVARMQGFAAWNGMPETVYLRRAVTTNAAGSRYAARIFSPRSELRFAGHPSLGAAHVAMETGLVTLRFDRIEDSFGESESEAATLWQQCGVGDVQLSLRRSAQGVQVFVKTPTPASCVTLAHDQCAAIAQALCCPNAVSAYRVSAGANWIVVKLDDQAALTALRADMAAIESLSHAMEVSGVTVYASSDDETEARFEVRSFGPAIGVPEDAVCGGGNACVAALQSSLDGLDATRPSIYRTRQGRFVGRDGRVHVVGPVDDACFWIGGATSIVMSGSVRI